MVRARVRVQAGALAIDGPRLACCLATRNGWPRMRNRNDRMTAGPAGRGWRCEWEYSRSLHVCDVFPATGRWLLRKALRQWPVDLKGERTPDVRAQPVISFIIGHRGMERLPHLNLTLETIRRQSGVEVECLVVEQDSEARIRPHLPAWVRYHQAPLPGGEIRYGRAAAFNAGARLARGEVLILHDNDLLAPRAYAAEVWQLHRQGYETGHLGRFFFYLDRSSSERLLARTGAWRNATVERVVENAAGGSTAISRAAFARIGGLDEEFIGWGGEDNEFWSRCLTRKTWNFGYLPFIHLWHPSLADRQRSNPSLALWERKRTVPVADRIAALYARQTAAAQNGGHVPHR